MTSEVRKVQDIPPALAVIGLFLVLGGLLYLESPSLVLKWQQVLDSYVDLHANLLGGVVLALSLNGIGIGATLAKVLGLNQQGSRLELLTGMRSEDWRKTNKDSLKTLGVSAASGLLVFGIQRILAFPGLQDLSPLPLSLGAAGAVLSLLQINFAVSAFVLTLMVSRTFSGKAWSTKLFRRLVAFPKPKNGLVLGSLSDDDPKAKPEWAIMTRKALNGNLLVTGSIGTGKTQGTILNYFDQVLSNFSPRPSILAIDPKGTFIPEALKMIRKHGLEEHVLHMRLDGNVTFNPIFSRTPLKKAQFSDISQMIRAAAINFTGRGADSPFWDLSASNLMKNTIALCGAKKSGSPFTLNDLYSEMVKASQDTEQAVTTLRELAEDAKFDEEEQFNLSKSAEYFEEYLQFDDKVRTGVLATATAFLNQFQEYQASRIFCPSLDRMTIQSMDEVVDGGKILLFDISSPALARSMGTFIKLHYEQSVLNRLTDSSRGVQRSAIIIADEYQDVVSTGAGVALGDDRFCSKSREANAIAIFASQSLTSIRNSVGKEDSAKELFQNFRTMISGHSTDLMTIHSFQELMGKEDRQKTSHSVSENAQRPSRNLISGGFEAKDANISESISTSDQKEYSVTGKEFSTLSSFECFARIYDGNHTTFRKLFLKPYFLEKREILHPKLLDLLKNAVSCVAIALLGASVLLSSSLTYAFPNVCTVVKTKEFMSCLNFNVGMCMCGWPVPRPCANFSYYVPQTFVEVFPNPKSSYFGDLPGAAAQLATLGSSVPFGAESDTDSQSFEAHTINVPLTMIPYETLPCGYNQVDRFCFESMSEHLGSRWHTGSADSLQPNWLAWSISPKACLLKGAASSITGEPEFSGSPTFPSCSVPPVLLPKYPPSSHSACNGWGIFYPRYGTYNGPSQTIGALMIASRMKSLATEVFNTTPSSMDEQWQMISPESSSCFKEGQNVGLLETIKNVREVERLVNGKLTGHLFTIWSKVSCCRDLAEIPVAVAAIAAMSLACQGLGAL